MNKYNKGQSLVDLIFSVGIIVLVLSGVVVLMVSSVSTKTRGFDRKTASRMAEVVMEKMVATKEKDPVGFFESGQSTYGKMNSTLTEFPGYTYSINFSDYSVPQCNVASCVMVVVTVDWLEKTPQTFVLNRVFSRV